jgi:hypothetical protein
MKEEQRKRMPKKIFCGVVTKAECFYGGRYKKDDREIKLESRTIYLPSPHLLFFYQIKAIIGATVAVIKRSELHTFVVLPKRWVYIYAYMYINIF